ncbi:hypothetical protein CDAR_235491 [Caerostris darwini]|uniref:Uncharacterized protein n=1 Tax=Caerostris darwini TaxID=1538125 RepID=A0AAV4NA42_9ARAC|nr:hypothetical protein CDAR_235491 [Caerostris darwini]
MNNNNFLNIGNNAILPQADNTSGNEQCPSTKFTIQSAIVVPIISEIQENNHYSEEILPRCLENINNGNAREELLKPGSSSKGCNKEASQFEPLTAKRNSEKQSRGNNFKNISNLRSVRGRKPSSAKVTKRKQKTTRISQSKKQKSEKFAENNDISSDTEDKEPNIPGQQSVSTNHEEGHVGNVTDINNCNNRECKNTTQEPLESIDSRNINDKNSNEAKKKRQLTKKGSDISKCSNGTSEKILQRKYKFRSLKSKKQATKKTKALYKGRKMKCPLRVKNFGKRCKK